MGGRVGMTRSGPKGAKRPHGTRSIRQPPLQSGCGNGAIRLLENDRRQVLHHLDLELRQLWELLSQDETVLSHNGCQRVCKRIHDAFQKVQVGLVVA